MKIKIIDADKVGLYQDNGSFIRTIGHGNVFYADLDKNRYLILITTTKGEVQLFTVRGLFIRNIGDGNALMAKFCRNNILVTTHKHAFEERKVSGELIRKF